MSNNLSTLVTAKYTPDNIQTFFTQLNSLFPIDLADLIEKKPLDEQILIFNALSQKQSVQTFEYLPFRVQKELLKVLSSQNRSDLLNALSPDDRTAFLEDLPKDTLIHFLQYLTPEEKLISIKLLGYPEDSIGRLMTPDYIAIKKNWTVKQVLDFIREKGKDSETINVIYVIDEKGILIDDIRIRQFLITSLETKVRDIVDNKFIALYVYDDRERAINFFRKYDRVALPVIDDKGLLLGIVTIDDILDLATEEDTEDIQKIGGVTALKESYMRIPFFQLFQKRIGWLVILFLGEMLTASAMGYYEAEIAKAVILALFLPLIISSGGNAGSQASTLIIRAMALGEVTLRDWWKIMRREIFIGVFLGTALGIVGFFRVAIWSYLFNMYGEHWFLVASTIFFSLIGVVLWGSLMGAMLPMILRRCGFDPAASSAPFVATLVDVTGLIIYFSIAMVILSGTLL